MSKPETTIIPTSKIIFNPETGLNETFIGTKEVIIYPYKKLEDGVDLQTEQMFYDKLFMMLYKRLMI